MEVGDKVEVEEDNLTQGIGGNHSNPPGLWMDIPPFERDRPRWVFYQYQVAERKKVNMAATYLDDVADAWFQN